MLGLHDFTIALLYILCIASTLLCVIYGILYWNQGGEKPIEPVKLVEWQKEEKELEEEL
jgi:hypothetical protein